MPRLEREVSVREPSAPFASFCGIESCTVLVRVLASAVTPARDRLESLDVLRGFALLGILIVNIQDYAPAEASRMDRVMLDGIEILGEGSFFPLFSLLFGVGFAVFIDRARAAGRAGTLAYIRRIVALFAIAVVQIVLLEDRNILLRYSFLAVPLLLFWRASATVCTGAAIVCFALPIGRMPINQALNAAQMQNPVTAERVKQTRAQEQRAREERQAAEMEAAGTRSYLAYAAYRARFEVVPAIRVSSDVRRNGSLGVIFTMFLLGVAVWRRGVLTDAAAHRWWFGRVAAVAGLLGIAGNVVLLGPRAALPFGLAQQPTLAAAIGMSSNVLLAAAYTAAILLLLTMQRARARWIRGALASIGRMGLTNYLWQSVAMSVLFLPYGFGLSERVPATGLLLIACAIYASHWAMSAAWLARFEFGPLEWLWRCATYLAVPRLRRQVTDVRVSTAGAV